MEVGAEVVSTEPSLLVVNVQLLGSYSSWKPNTVAALALVAAAKVRPKVATVSAVYDRADSIKFEDLVIIKACFV